MATTWANVIRQVLLRGNFFAGDAAALAAIYATANFTDAAITKSGGEYSFAAIVDANLQAHQLLVKAIGMNRNSEHRRWFQDVTAPIAHGGLIPTLGTGTRERFGVISDVKDATVNRYCTEQPREMIEIARKTLPRRKLTLYQYFSDDLRIWHTRQNVVCEIVSWDRAAERALILANNTTAVCLLPDSLLPILEDGTLHFIHRDTFNAEASIMYWNKFAPELERIAATPMAAPELAVKV